jgi:NaMN:DMB phosphoribosyltransferase
VDVQSTAEPAELATQAPDPHVGAADTMAEPGTPSVGSAPVDDHQPEFLPGIAVPLPDDAAVLGAWERLTSMDIGVNAPTIAGLGMLAESVAFIAGVQAHPYPRPILSTRVVLVVGAHAGGAVAGSAPDPGKSIPLQQLASAAGAGIVTLEWQPAAAAIEFEDAITQKQLDAAMRAGWAEAERAADEGIELLILAAGGPGSTAAAIAVISAISGYETSALLGRVATPSGFYDDNAWMTRAVALRDAMHRVRHRDGDPRTVLAALGGADLAAATGLLLGAASRRLPVMIDGPVGAAAAMVANDFAPSVRRWLMLPDHGRNVAVIVAAEALELRPWLDLCLDLGEGSTSLSALPLLQMALTLAGAGTPVEAAPLTRFDAASGSQVFVGVARPVEPEEAEDERPEPSAALTAPTTSIGAKAKGAARPAPPKPTPAKAPRKNTGSRAKGGGPRATPAKAGAAKATTGGAGAAKQGSGSATGANRAVSGRTGAPAKATKPPAQPDAQSNPGS